MNAHVHAAHQALEALGIPHHDARAAIISSVLLTEGHGLLASLKRRAKEAGLYPRKSEPFKSTQAAKVAMWESAYHIATEHFDEIVQIVQEHYGDLPENFDCSGVDWQSA